MTFDEMREDREQAHFDRAEKRRRSKDDQKQNRLIQETPELDIGV
jgi:hypothetical protein